MKERNKTASFAIWAGGQAARMVLLLLLVSMVSFVLLSVSPLDPLQTNVGQAALGSMSPEQIERLRTYWGVDVPPVRRYTLWLIDLLKGDMGVSLLYRRPVTEVIAGKLSNSLGLLLTAWFFSGHSGREATGRFGGPADYRVFVNRSQHAGILGSHDAFDGVFRISEMVPHWTQCADRSVRRGGDAI